ncbi:MAG: tRNA (adenosine(37)-N6)-threonylcarbamoyltransferase complex transferase subunit TsaD [Elusimicrobia bacterium]|nr:tRNA (adenosine(37)-N6)-threonylcarbamoyltransferase complex transferase subunit TsaD [Elusimicrobiota bacterium]
MKRLPTAGNGQPLVLGIETSCDETAAAVVAGGRILSSVVSSQVALHRRFQGVVPELASRAHLQKIGPVVGRALDEARVSRTDVVAFTRGPGLMGSLLVGSVAARTLSRLWGCPLIGVNHLEGHIFAAELGSESRPIGTPFVALIVSGGHTDLILSERPGGYRVLGRTRDDAAGEAFDKIARLLGLGYPGGPAIDRRAASGDSGAEPFPRPLLPGTWDFSFSGLKTAVYYRVKDGPRPGRTRVSDLCAGLQAAVTETLIQKTLAAARRHGVRDVVLGGGVAANSALRRGFKALREQGLRVAAPPRPLCTDNGAMIAHAAGRMLRLGSRSLLKRLLRPCDCLPARSLRPDPSLPLASWAS